MKYAGSETNSKGPLTLTCIRITLKIGLMIGTRREISTYADICKSENSNHVAEITI